VRRCVSDAVVIGNAKATDVVAFSELWGTAALTPGPVAPASAEKGFAPGDGASGGGGASGQF